MSGFWAIFWMGLVLKIPIVALLYLVWWASRPPVEEEDDAEDRGGSDRDPHRGLQPPRPPRRGPHGEPLPPAPERVRVARGRTSSPA